MDNNLQIPSYNNPLSFFEDQFKKNGLTNLSVVYAKNYTLATSEGLSLEDFLLDKYNDEVEKSIELIHSHVTKQSSEDTIKNYLKIIIGEIKDLYLYIENNRPARFNLEIFPDALKNIIKTLSIKYEQYLPQLKESNFFDGWISDSMEVFKPEQQISTKELTTKENDFKITLNLSVGQVALFVRILKEAGVIDAKYNTDIYRHIQAYFSSKSKENLAESSFKNKWDNPSKTEINKLFVLLDDMKYKLSKIDKKKQN
jgi:hypothetical protein